MDWRILCRSIFLGTAEQTGPQKNCGKKSFCRLRPAFSAGKFRWCQKTNPEGFIKGRVNS